MDAVSGPILSAPSLRETKSIEQVRQYFQGDLAQVRTAAQQWVQQTAAREIANQIQLGNSKQYTQTVDGSTSKPLSAATQKVVVIFATTLLARKLAQAQTILTAAILRVTKVHTGLLSSGWEWSVQRGGKNGQVQSLGPSIPNDLTLRTGDALILAPRAAYAWFANYNAARAQSFVPSEVKRQRAGKAPRRHRPPRGFGFMAYAARRLRADLSRIGVSVWPRFSTALAPNDTRAQFGVPILVFVVSKRLQTLQ
jgi:hypothetical protein